MARRKISKGLTFLMAIVFLVVGVIGGFYGYYQETLPNDSDVFVSGDLEIHFLELGNKYTGDCVYVKMGDTDLRIDAGSKTSSIPTISKYLKQNMVTVLRLWNQNSLPKRAIPICKKPKSSLKRRFKAQTVHLL